MHYMVGVLSKGLGTSDGQDSWHLVTAELNPLRGWCVVQGLGPSDGQDSWSQHPTLLPNNIVPGDATV